MADKAAERRKCYIIFVVKNLQRQMSLIIAKPLACPQSRHSVAALGRESPTPFQLGRSRTTSVSDASGEDGPEATSPLTSNANGLSHFDRADVAEDIDRTSGPQGIAS
jgi:hypothetical protein